MKLRRLLCGKPNKNPWLEIEYVSEALGGGSDAEVCITVTQTPQGSHE